MSDADQHTGEASPRAFVTATGFVFQMIGFVFAVGGCLLWSLTGFLEQPLAEPINVVGDYVQRGAVARTITLACLVLTLLSGVGLIATGIGMQGERRGSGRWALAITGVLAAVWLTATIGYWWFSAAPWKIITAAFFTGVGTVLFLLAGNSARILKLHPPPTDANVASEEFLREYSRGNIEE